MRFAPQSGRTCQLRSRPSQNGSNLRITLVPLPCLRCFCKESHEMSFPGPMTNPQRLKPSVYGPRAARLKAVPFHKTIYETSWLC
jgi:hypothetical protein